MPELPPVTMKVLPSRSRSVLGWKVMFEMIRTRVLVIQDARLK
jgi:hypothetical protein